MRDRQRCHDLVAVLIRHHQNNGAGAVFESFLLAALMFGLPQIDVADDVAGHRKQWLCFHFAIESSCSCGRLYVFDCRNVGISEIRQIHNLAIAPIEPD